jgi:Bacterial TSP3 repeat
MSDINRSRGHSSSRRRSDLRFAGMVSAGMIATVVTAAALLAPLLAWNSAPGPNARERSQTVRLGEPPARSVPRTAPYSADRPAHVVAVPGSRAGLSVPIRTPAATRAAGAAPSQSLAERFGVSGRSEQTSGARRGAPPASAAFDTDGDGLPDVWERAYGLNPDNAADAAQDSDGDGLDNLTELHIRTAPNGTDSDGNGVADGAEDSDADGLRNDVELRADSNPWQADSNGDGITDAQDDADGDGAPNLAEQQAGTDPGSSNEVPPVVEPNPTPVVIPDEPDVEDDGGAGNPAPDPPAPEHPDQQGGDTQAPAPQQPAPADDGGDHTPQAPAPPADDPAPKPAPSAPADAPADEPAPAPSAPAHADHPAPTPAALPQTAPTPAPAPAAPAPAATTPARTPAAATPAHAATTPTQTAAAPTPAATRGGGDDDAGAHGWGHRDRGGHGSRFSD